MALIILWLIISWAVMLVAGILGAALGYPAALGVAALLMLIKLLL